MKRVLIYIHLTIALALFISGCRKATTARPDLTATQSPLTQQQDAVSISPTAPQQAPTATPSPTPTAVVIASPTSPTPSAEVQPAPTEPSAAPSPTATQTAAAPGEMAGDTAGEGSSAADCLDQAAFYADVTVPDGTIFRQGETFTKTWRVRNTGTCAWDAGYALVFGGGLNFNAAPENPVTPAQPGDIIDVSLNLTAPGRGGTYISNWFFRNGSGEVFGVGASGKGPLWTEIVITFVGGESGGPSSSPGSGGSGSSSSPTGCNAQPDTAFDNELLAIINNARAARGLDALEWQEQLAAAALAHSTDMACNNFVDHVGSDGTLWYDRVSAQGYANYNSARENIRVGSPDFGFTPQYVYDQWFASPVHNENMFFPRVSQIGISYVFNTDSEYGGYVTTVFARP